MFMQINKIFISNFDLERNVFVKDLSFRGTVTEYWKYKINGVDYYIPNLGYLVMIDSNFGDVEFENDNSFICSLNISSAPSNNIDFEIKSSDTSEVLPTKVQIPAGKTSISFELKIIAAQVFCVKAKFDAILFALTRQVSATVLVPPLVPTKICNELEITLCNDLDIDPQDTVEMELLYDFIDAKLLDLRTSGMLADT